MRFLFLFLFLFAKKLNAQTTSGARFMAMANAGSALEGVYSLGGNQAGVASVDQLKLALTFHEHNYSTDVRSIAAFFVFPSSIGVLGFYANMYNLGYDLNELRGGLTLSRLLTSKFAVAGTLNYHHRSISEYGIDKALSFDLGFQYKLSEYWLLGTHFINPLAYISTDELSYEIPAQIRLGASYMLSNQVLLAMESRLSMDKYQDFRLGLEYSIITSLNLRGGTSFLPFKRYVGVGVDFNKISVDVASSFHPQLGMSSQFALNYAF